MNTKTTAFESLKVVKVRLYPLLKEKRIEEWNGLKQNEWATKDRKPTRHNPRYKGEVCGRFFL